MKALSKYCSSYCISKMISVWKMPPGLCVKASHDLEKRGSRPILYMLIGDIIIYVSYVQKTSLSFPSLKNVIGKYRKDLEKNVFFKKQIKGQSVYFVFHPIQQPGSHMDRPSALVLVGFELRTLIDSSLRFDAVNCQIDKSCHQFCTNSH